MQWIQQTSDQSWTEICHWGSILLEKLNNYGLNQVLARFKPQTNNKINENPHIYDHNSSWSSIQIVLNLLNILSAQKVMICTKNYAK